MPEAGWFNQKTLFSLSFAGWEGQGQVAGWSGAWWRPAFCLVSVTWQDGRGLGSSRGYLMRALIPLKRAPSSWTLQRPHLVNTITLQSWDFKVHILGRDKLSVCNEDLETLMPFWLFGDTLIFRLLVQGLRVTMLQNGGWALTHQSPCQVSANLFCIRPVHLPPGLWCWRRLLRVPWTARKSNKSMLNQSWIFTGWSDVEALVPQPPDAKLTLWKRP